MKDCIFCKISEKKIPSKIVYEDKSCLAFEDLNPKAPVHILLIPKKHISNISSAKENDESLLGKLLAKAAMVAQKKVVEKSGYRVVINCGRDAGEQVPHLHFHILGGRNLNWPPG